MVFLLLTNMPVWYILGISDGIYARKERAMTAIRYIRKRLNMTQEQLSERTGISQANMSRYESGERKLTLENAAKIANALGCTVDELLKEQ